MSDRPHAQHADAVCQFVRVLRNGFLHGLGWRRRFRATNQIDGDEDEGAITLMTVESRPWWEHDRIVDEKIVDWEQDHD